jgi:hypothetical protein
MFFTHYVRKFFQPRNSEDQSFESAPRTSALCELEALALENAVLTRELGRVQSRFTLLMNEKNAQIDQMHKTLALLQERRVNRHL